MRYLRYALLGLLAGLVALVAGPRSTYAWTAPEALNSNAGSDSGLDSFPQVTTDGAGNWVAVWYSTEANVDGGIGTDYDILVSRSTNSGATWTAPAALNGNAGSDSGDDYSSQVTTDGAGNWVAVWQSEEANVGGGIGTDFDILVSRSTDNGATWTAPAALNTNAGTDLGYDGFAQVTSDGAGNWVAVWYSREANVGGGIGTDDDILVSRSTDNGATWTAPAALNTNAGTDLGYDGFAQVMSDGAGNWVAVWTSEEANVGGGIGTDPDILVSRSTDNGATWTPPAALNTNAGSDSGDDWQPQVTTDGAGNWVAVWYSEEANVGGGIGTDYDILVSRSTDNGAIWAAPAALNTNAGTDSGNDARPQVTTDGAGHWVAVWHSDEANMGGGIGTDDDILVSRSTDNGATWTAPAALNTNASTDSGWDGSPQVTTDGAGNWVAVWKSIEANVGGGIGTDEDILYSTEVDADLDGVPDADDNCPDTPNLGQENNVHPGTPEGDHCEDPDGDGFADWYENFMTTDPDDGCAADNTPNNEDPPDAWPFDFDDNQMAALADVLSFIPVFNTFPPSPPSPYDPRWDLNTDAGITLADVLSFIPVFNLTCTP